MAAASFLRSTPTAQPTDPLPRSTVHHHPASSHRGVRFPAWAFARRIRERHPFCQHQAKVLPFPKIRELQHHIQQAQQKNVEQAKSGSMSGSMSDSHPDGVLANKTMDTVPTAESTESTESSSGSSVTPPPTPQPQEPPRLLLRMDVTGYRPADLRVHVDVKQQQLIVAGMGPRMFKRVFPLPSATTTATPPRLQAILYSTHEPDTGDQRSLLCLVSAPPSTAAHDDESGVVGSDRYNSIPVQTALSQ